MCVRKSNFIFIHMKALSQGIRDLITEYFDCDVLADNYDISEGFKKNIIETFTYAYNNHLSKRAINKELEGSNIYKLREKIRSNNKPFPVRWGDLKPKLQMEAIEKNISMHAACREIVREHFERQENPPYNADKWIRNLFKLAKRNKLARKMGRKKKENPVQLRIFPGN